MTYTMVSDNRWPTSARPVLGGEDLGGKLRKVTKD